MKKLAVILILVFTGCGARPYVGVAAHLEKDAEPEISNFYSPLGVVGIRKMNGQFEMYCQHTSSIGTLEVGRGLNSCGANYEIDIK